MSALIDAIQGWARTVVAISLMAAVIDMLLPSGTTRVPVRMVIGVLVVLAVSSPLVGLFARLPALAADISVPAVRGRPADVVGHQLVTRIERALSAVPGVSRVDARVVMNSDRSLIPTAVTVVITIEDQEPEGIVDEATHAVALLTGLDHDRIRVEVRTR